VYMVGDQEKIFSVGDIPWLKWVIKYCALILLIGQQDE